MKRPAACGRIGARNVLGSAGALAVGVAVALACAGSSEQTARAGSTPAAGDSGAGDAGAVSSFVAHAQRSEVVPPSLDEVERMCALLTSCDRLPIPPSLIPADFEACTKKMMEDMTSPAAVYFSLTMRECGLQSDSCASFRTCALHGANPEACTGRGKQGLVGFCDVDGRAMTCWHEQMLAVRDCPRGGEQCIVVGGQATCTLGPCPGDMKDSDKPRCSGSGSHILHCEKGKIASLDCAAFGLKCSVQGDGTAGCASAGPPCSGDAKRCDGNVAVGCFNGHEVRVDCASAGLSCGAAPGGVAVGACVAVPPAAGGCDAGDKARCDDDAVRYCFAGRPRSYSCKAVGFGKCQAGKNGVRCAR